MIGRTALIAATSSLMLAGVGCARILAGSRAHEFADNQYREGQSEEARGDLDEAEDCYEDALDLDPKHALALRRLGQLKTAVGEHETAVAYLRRALDVTGGSAQAWDDLAQCFEAAALPEDAETTYRAGIEAHPDDMRLRRDFGIMLAGHGRASEGLAQMRAVMSDEEARLNLGLARKSGAHPERRPGA